MTGGILSPVIEKRRGRTTANLMDQVPPSNTRRVEIDLLKGFAILMVVLGHTLRGLETKGIDTAWLYAYFDPRLYAVHVQLLFLLSGILLPKALSKTSVNSFGASRFWKILLPMILWTYIFLLAKVMAGPLQNAPIELKDLIFLPIPGYLHLWFLWALFLIQLLAAVIWALARAIDKPTATFVLAAALSIGLSQLRLPGEATYWAGQAVTHLPFFLIGCCLALTGTVDPPHRSLFWLAPIVFVGIFLWVPTLQEVFSKSAVSIFLCLTALWSAPALSNLHRLTSILIILGLSSMAIYVMHTIFAAGTREVLFRLGTTDGSLHIILGTVAGILGPLLFLRLAPVRWKKSLAI